MKHIYAGTAISGIESPPIGLETNVQSSTSIILSWTDTAAIKREYKVRWNPKQTGRGVPEEPYRYMDSDKKEVAITGLKPNTEYEFAVKAIDRATGFETAWSLLTSAATKPDGKSFLLRLQ